MLKAKAHRASSLCSTALLFTLALSAESFSQDEFPVLTGPYLGQTPPGLVAETFAPGIISTNGWELEGVFAPGMQEF